MKSDQHDDVQLIAFRLIPQKWIFFHAHSKVECHDDEVLSNLRSSTFSLAKTFVHCLELCDWAEDEWVIVCCGFLLWRVSSQWHKPRPFRHTVLCPDMQFWHHSTHRRPWLGAQPVWTEEEEGLTMPQAVVDTLLDDIDDADSDEEEGFGRDGTDNYPESCCSDKDWLLTMSDCPELVGMCIFHFTSTRGVHFYGTWWIFIAILMFW